MRKLLLLLFWICVCEISIAQKVETVYLNPLDSTSNFYIIYYPNKLPWDGYMFLIQGMFQKAENVIIQTELPKYAAKEGILTIIPVFKTGISSFGIDAATQASFLEILNHVTTTYKLTGKRFYIGGFSIGGTCAIKYAELALGNNYPIKPSAVFALDAPLDFERRYKAIQREKRLITDGTEPDAEGVYTIELLKNVFGGTPNDSLQNYYKLSPYSFNDTSQQVN